MIIDVRVPFVTAAARKSCCASLSVRLRAKRAYFVQPTTESAKIVLAMLPPSMPAMAIASTKPEKASTMSVKRMSKVSTLPPTKPAMMPTSVPKTDMMKTMPSAMAMEILMP